MVSRVFCHSFSSFSFVFSFDTLPLLSIAIFPISPSLCYLSLLYSPFLFLHLFTPCPSLSSVFILLSFAVVRLFLIFLSLHPVHSVFHSFPSFSIPSHHSPLCTSCLFYSFSFLLPYLSPFLHIYTHYHHSSYIFPLFLCPLLPSHPSSPSPPLPLPPGINASSIPY